MNLLRTLHETKIIAIVRGISEKDADCVAGALAAGGIKLLEVTLNTDGALNMIRRWKERFTGQLRIGAGTVLNLAMAKDAIEAGAEYLIAPHLDEAVIAYALEHGVEIWPGAMTPTEIVRAWNLGAGAVKVFPTGFLGHEYIKELQGPLSHIPMIATGGVNLDNIGQFFDAGAIAVGLGGNLVDKSLIAAGQFELLTERAAKFVEAATRKR